jgi:hypothetical protein
MCKGNPLKMLPPPEPGKPKWPKSLTFFLLLAVFFVGLILTAYLSVISEYVPAHQKVVFRNGTDLDVILTIDNDMQIPLQNYFFHKSSLVKSEIYFKSVPIFIKDVKLASNSTAFSSSIITVKDANVTNPTPKSRVWVAPVEVGHSLGLKNYSEPYYLDIYYRKGKDVGSLMRETIPFVWSVTTLDFGQPSYFWIVFSGVLLSRVFTFTTEPKISGSIHFTKLELLWVPFSAFITLLIFSGFKDQFHPTQDIITNLALAFGFGFGFDKIFEVWSKAPKSRPD